MESTYNNLGNPGIFRNDRFWLAGDHVVDPRVNNIPRVKGLIATSERARDQFKLTEYQGMNVSYSAKPDLFFFCLRPQVHHYAYRVCS